MLNLFKNPRTVKAPVVKTQYSEITCCGFVPATYLAYATGNFDKSALCTRIDGTKMISFKNGDIIIELAQGQLLVIDKDGRVTMARVLESAIPDSAPKCSMEKSALVNLKTRAGVRETTLPGGITVTTTASSVEIKINQKLALSFGEFAA